MGHKVSPTSFRLQVKKNWGSKWFAGRDYARQLHEDLKIRKFVLNSLGMRAGISHVEIDRNANQISVSIYTAKPGVVIGRGGTGATELKAKLSGLTIGKIKDINVFEVKNPDANAQIIADNIAQQLERRIAFKRAMRQTVEKAQRAGVKGIKIMVGGRLNGAEIARSEYVIKGKIPLATIDAEIDYATSRAKTTYGIIGVKVWVFNGMAETTHSKNGEANEKKTEATDVNA
jgi:small subunit ribosomal protein S3